jgi:hypothetical protein
MAGRRTGTRGHARAARLVVIVAVTTLLGSVVTSDGALASGAPETPLIPVAPAQVTPAASPLPAASDATLAPLYAALRPRNLRATDGPRAVARGSEIELSFEMVNPSGRTVEVPTTVADGRPASWYGTIRSWIQRYGADPSLDACLPAAARKGAWYATGGAAVAFRWSPGSIVPGDGITQHASLSAAMTACLPAGSYRYRVEYARLEAVAGDDPIAAVALDIELRQPTHWTADLAAGPARGGFNLQVLPGALDATETVSLSGLGAGATASLDVRADACDRDGQPLVAAQSVTADAGGSYRGIVSVPLAPAARDAIAAGAAVSVRLTAQGWSGCSAARVMPLVVPGRRAPTTWGGGLLRDRLPGRFAVIASSETVGGRPAQAVDGQADRTWNAGDWPPAWIEIDLGRDRLVTGITLLPSQLPNVATTVHRVYGRADGRTGEVLLAEVKGVTTDNVWRRATFERSRRVRYVRVETVESPSWVAWREIAVIGPDLPPRSLMPIGTHDGSVDAVASGDRCYANGWAVDPDAPTRRLTVRVLVDGRQVWSGLARQSRPDVAAAGIGDGFSGFWVDLQRLVTHGRAHAIRVQARDLGTGRWADLNLTPRTLTCS